MQADKLYDLELTRLPPHVPGPPATFIYLMMTIQGMGFLAASPPTTLVPSSCRRILTTSESFNALLDCYLDRFCTFLLLHLYPWAIFYLPSGRGKIAQGGGIAVFCTVFYFYVLLRIKLYIYLLFLPSLYWHRCPRHSSPGTWCPRGRPCSRSGGSSSLRHAPCTPRKHLKN